MDDDSPEKRSLSRSRTSRPTTPMRPQTPLRASSRSSFRESAKASTSGDGSFPLNTFEPAFAELSDSMADLEANMMHFQLMHESLSRFNESFASFLYGLNMNAFCVDFPEGPTAESFKRSQQADEQLQDDRSAGDIDGDMTFLTTDTSFVDNPSVAGKTATPRKPALAEPRPSRVPAPSVRGTRGSRGLPRGTRPSGLARARGRGVR